MSGLWPLICISQVAHRGLLWYLALCCFFPRTLLPSHWCRSERVRPIGDEKQLSSYTRERMWNFSWGKKKKRSRENDLEFIHKIRYSTETTKQLAREGSGQTLLTARNGLPKEALQNLYSIPALSIILYSYILHPTGNQLSSLQLSHLVSHLPNHPGHK